MSIDTLRTPPGVQTTLTWYSATDTTPFALAGHIGPVLAELNPERYGAGSAEVWFVDNGWEMPSGEPIDSDDVRAFALMPLTPSQLQAGATAGDADGPLETSEDDAITDPAAIAAIFERDAARQADLI